MKIILILFLTLFMVSCKMQFDVTDSKVMSIQKTDSVCSYIYFLNDKTPDEYQNDFSYIFITTDNNLTKKDIRKNFRRSNLFVQPIVIIRKIVDNNMENLCGNYRRDYYQRLSLLETYTFWNRLSKVTVVKYNGFLNEIKLLFPSKDEILVVYSLLFCE